MTEKKAASEEEMEKLHAILARKLTDILNSGEYTAAELNVARQFLKDNGINAIPKPKSELDKLRNSLPFADPRAIQAEEALYN